MLSEEPLDLVSRWSEEHSKSESVFESEQFYTLLLVVRKGVRLRSDKEEATMIAVYKYLPGNPLRSNQNDERPKQGAVSAPQGRSAYALESVGIKGSRWSPITKVDVIYRNRFSRL